jgi:hypothetical protein
MISLDAEERTPARAEATAISRWTAALSGILVLGAGILAFVGNLQASGLALFGALAMSIASVVGRPSRGWRWVGPVVVGAALVAEAIVTLP